MDTDTTADDILNQLDELGVDSTLLSELETYLQDGRTAPELVRESEHGTSTTSAQSVTKVIEAGLKALLRDYDCRDEQPFLLSFVAEYGPGLDENQYHGRVKISGPGLPYGPELRYSFHADDQLKEAWLAFRERWDMASIHPDQLRPVYRLLDEYFYEHDGTPLSGFDGVDELIDALNERLNETQA